MSKTATKRTGRKKLSPKASACVIVPFHHNCHLHCHPHKLHLDLLTRLEG